MSAPAADAAAVTVTNVAQLTSALAAAHGGDIIRLAPGVYSDLGRLRGLNFPSRVTITSADAAHPGVITPFYIYNSSNIMFDHVEFSAAGSTDPHAYRVYESNNIAFDHDVFHGTMDVSPSDEPMNGIAFFTCKNISVTNSEFTHLMNGMGVGDTNGAVVANNSFHDMRNDGIDSAKSSDVVIEDNVFTDFYFVKGDHPDAIQWWGGESNDVVIRGNLYVRGAGRGVQGIFMNDNRGWAKNVTIADNIIAGGAFNGIDVTGADDINILSNTVAAYPDQESWIRLEGNVGGKEANNASFMYIFQNNAKVSQANNRTYGATSDGGRVLVVKWLAAHPGWTGTLPASLSRLVGSAAGGGHAPSAGANHAVVGEGSARQVGPGLGLRGDQLSFDPVLFERAISGHALRAAAGSAGL